MSPEVAAVFWLVVTARFVLPLFIPKFPLPAIIACLVLDGIDQTIFQSFGYDPPGYQGYDKAMDNFYLAMAYLSTLRNWTSVGAVRVARFLFFYRLVGVVLFELSGLRPLLLIFPNTFEYFFIAYETIRTRWNPLRIGFAGWVKTAAAIWIFVKLPQEYWIHVAQLDFTDTVKEVSWFLPAIVVAALALLGVLWFVVRPRLPRPDWSWRFAADPVPEEMDSAAERSAWTREHGRVWSMDTLENVVMVGLLSVIYGQVLPTLDTGPLRLFVMLAALILVSTAISLWAMRRGSGGLESFGWAFGARVLLNLGIIVAAVLLPLPFTPARGELDWTAVSFFVVLLSLLSTAHDRYGPIHAVRQEAEEPSPAS